MNIQQHIKNLLFRHDCVIVKGLGGFVCQRQSAQIKDGYFLPPKKTLSFNSSLNQSDGLLANYVAKTEKVSFQIAQQKILAFSHKVLSTLDEENVYLKDLGYFKQNKDSKLIFEPDPKNNWLTEAYGLPKFQISEIPTVQPQPIIAAVKPETEVKILSENKPKPSYWKYAAVGVIALGIAGLLGSQIYQKDIKVYNIAEQQRADELVNKKIQSSSFLINSPLKALSVEIKTQEENTGKYHIVGGAFRIKANADKKIAQLKEKGFDAKYLGTNDYGLHIVAYASFSDKDKALYALKQIKSKNNPYAWLYVKEL